MTMFENEMKDKLINHMKDKLINHMRKTIANEIAIGNSKIKNELKLGKKIEAMEKTAERIKVIIDFMYDSDILDVETYSAEHDRLINWEMNKISKFYH